MKKFKSTQHFIAIVICSTTISMYVLIYMHLNGANITSRTPASIKKLVNNTTVNILGFYSQVKPVDIIKEVSTITVLELKHVANTSSTKRRYISNKELINNKLGLYSQVKPVDIIKEMSATTVHELKHVANKSRTIGSSRIEASVLTDEKRQSKYKNAWQKVGDILGTLVYSAIYDDIAIPIIRVIAVARGPHESAPSPKFTCRYFNQNATMMAMDIGQLQYVPEPTDWGYSYLSGMIKCELPMGLRPHAVGISEENTTRGDNRLRILYPLQVKWNLTRCYSVLHNNFDNVMQIIQTMELSLMFGIDHYVVYIQNVSGRVLNVLKKYRNMGVLEILVWNIPLNRTQIHYIGQLAAMQECLYRNLHVSRYILTGDFDEVFVPKSHRTMSEMLKETLIATSGCSCLTVKNMFFPLNMPMHSGNFTSRAQAERLNLTFLLHTRHLRINLPTVRSKLIYRPPDIEIIGIHGVEVYRGGRTGCICPASKCLLHHYRRMPSVEWRAWMTQDLSLHRYADTFVKRVVNISKNISMAASNYTQLG